MDFFQGIGLVAFAFSELRSGQDGLEQAARRAFNAAPSNKFGRDSHHLGIVGDLRMIGRAQADASGCNAAEMRQAALRLIDEGNASEDAGLLDIAMQRYESAIAIAPDVARGHLNRGNILLSKGDVEGALAAYATALEKDPNYPGAHFNMGNVCARLGRNDAALAAYRRALELQPDFVDAEVAVGNVLMDLDRLEEAVASFRRAIRSAPDLAGAHFYLGGALRMLGRLDEAVASYRDAVRIRPEFAEALYNMGEALEWLVRLDEAVHCYRRAIGVSPSLVEAHCNLGNVLRKLGKDEEGLACFRRAIELRADFADAHNNMGNALRSLGRLDEAEASLRRALEIRPEFFEAHSNLGNVLEDLLRLGEAEASYRRALEIRPDFAPAQHNLLFCLSHDEAIDAGMLFAEHRRFGERVEGPVRASWPRHGNVRDPARCLQVGFVSGDLREHAVAHFVEPILEWLSGRPGLSLHAYYNHATEGHVTARLRGHMKHWNRIVELTDEALARKIAADGIDILIDLSGHTAENRLLAFARKPAPVQASWIGYPGTTGLAAMDYYVADRHFLPLEKFGEQFTEKLVYLPANAPFLPDERTPPVNTLPALRQGYVTFGSFNRPDKLSRPVIALWSRLLREMPTARMLLGGMPQEGVSGALCAWFEEEGVERERLAFHRRCDLQSYLRLHHQVDLCLDTFPYTGGTTTSHALWMGLPTLTLAGRSPPGRQSASILGHLGLHDFVAEDADEFVAKGVRWARDPASLAGLRADMRERYGRSTLRRPEVIAAGLERALRTMWQRWCAGLPVQTIDVTGDFSALGNDKGDSIGLLTR